MIRPPPAMKTPRLIATALAPLLALAACTKRETDVEAGIRTKTLLLCNDAEPGSLDPHVNQILLAEQCIFMALFEGLTALDERTAQGVPAVAERWDVSPDGLVYTFHLRSSARWSNGDPVTAADFAFAFRRILTPEFGAQYAYLLHPIKNAARRLLTEAGFPAGRGLPAVEFQVFQGGSDHTVGEVIQETWRRELGVVSTIAIKEIKVAVQNMQTMDSSVGITGWGADFADPATFLEVFLGKGTQNRTGWANPEYDRLIAEAARTLDPERRFEHFQQAEALLLEEAPIAPLCFDAKTYLIHPAVKGWVPAPLGLRRYQYVWLEK